jgi:hypothetical protein
MLFHYRTDFLVFRSLLLESALRPNVIVVSRVLLVSVSNAAFG